MMTLIAGWEEKLIELNVGRIKGYGRIGMPRVCEGKPVKNRIKEIYKMISAGQAVVVEKMEVGNG